MLPTPLDSLTLLITLTWQIDLKPSTIFIQAT